MQHRRPVRCCSRRASSWRSSDCLPAGEAGVLACYRDVARVPVLAVNMQQPQDCMLLWMTSVAIHVGINVP
jgi:hypothetical protein